MPEVEITIGERVFRVACQPGEEAHLRSAAKLLDNEATHLINAAGRLPEPKMLLMAGLMLADKMAGMQEADQTPQVDTGALEGQIEAANARIGELEAQLASAGANLEALEQAVTDAEALAQEIQNA